MRDHILRRAKFTRRAVIVDVAARSRKLIIELDGEIHTDQARDGRRTARLEQQGYRVIRFTNADMMFNEAAVVRSIIDALRTARLPRFLSEGRSER